MPCQANVSTAIWCIGSLSKDLTTKQQRHILDVHGTSNKDMTSNNNTGSTTLTTHVKSLRNNNIPHDISWDFIEHASPFNPATWWCRLCVLESYYILFEPGGASLNQRSEFFSHCYHQKPQLLGNKKWFKFTHLHSKFFSHSSQSQLSFFLVLSM